MELFVYFGPVTRLIGNWHIEPGYCCFCPIPSDAPGGKSFIYIWKSKSPQGDAVFPNSRSGVSAYLRSAVWAFGASVAARKINNFRSVKTGLGSCRSHDATSRHLRGAVGSAGRSPSMDVIGGGAFETLSLGRFAGFSPSPLGAGFVLANCKSRLLAILNLTLLIPGASFPR